MTLWCHDVYGARDDLSVGDCVMVAERINSWGFSVMCQIYDLTVPLYVGMVCVGMVSETGFYTSILYCGVREMMLRCHVVLWCKRGVLKALPRPN